MKVLVVDDEPVIADTLADILAGEGHQAFAVSDGEAAIRWTEMLRPDAVITDVIMPGMDGVEVARRIAAILPGCRVILFSGQAASTALVEHARAEGYTFEVLAKPINPETLLEKLKSAPAGAVGRAV